MLRRMFTAAIVGSLLLGVGGAAETLGYDPQADPFEQLAAGDWCSWCHYLDAFVKRDADVARALYDTFVVVKVYYGDENKNERFFGSWPEAAGYPHFWIFSADGNLLRSQGTLELEDGGKSYDKEAFLAFAAQWSARR